jgi:hypothetical protein
LAYESGEQLNIRAVKKLKMKNGRRLDIFLKGYNLTDNRYDMPWQFRDPGLSLTAGIKAVF